MNEYQTNPWNCRQKMNAQRKASFLFSLLVTLACCVLLTSCNRLKPATGDVLQAGFADLRSTAQNVIVDPARREVYLEHCQALESDLMAFERYAAGFIDGYRQAFTDYAVDQRALAELSAAFREQQQVMQTRFVELHLAMAGAVTPQEWQPLAAKETRIVESLLQAATGATK